jgi:hypothetical protein
MPMSMLLHLLTILTHPSNKQLLCSCFPFFSFLLLLVYKQISAEGPTMVGSLQLCVCVVTLWFKSAHSAAKGELHPARTSQSSFMSTLATAR